MAEYFFAQKPADGGRDSVQGAEGAAGGYFAVVAAAAGGRVARGRRAAGDSDAVTVRAVGVVVARRAVCGQEVGRFNDAL